MFDEVKLSPNYGYPRGTKGRNGHKIIGACNHISGGEYAGNIAWMMQAKASASYNVLVKRDGTPVMLVDPANAAWSHGKLNKYNWPLLKSGVNPNLYTLSIARVGSDQRKWDEPQMETIVRIHKEWAKQYGYPAEWPHIFGHRHIDSVDRWYCPGDEFLKELYVRLAIDDAPPVEEEDTDTLWQVIAGAYVNKQNAEMVRGNLLRMGVAGVYLNPIKRPKR
jgi:N-acetyl-anhydromuramyl-L-alanine amidase AmpD